MTFRAAFPEAVVTSGAVAGGSVAAGAALELNILGVPESVLLVAIAGSAFGAWMSIGSNDTLERATKRRVTKWLAFYAMVSGWGLLAAWLTMLIHPVVGSGLPLLPLAGVCGVSIRALTPKILGMVDTLIDRFGRQAGGFNS